MLTDNQLTEVATLVSSGSGLRAAIAQVTGVDPSIQLMTWLRDNHYQMLTDAKGGAGHAERQAVIREAMKGTG